MAAPLTFTPKALQMARAHAARPVNEGKSVRVWLAGKGCDGFIYDLGFDESLPGDQQWNLDGVTLVMDEATLKVLRRGTVDWVTDESGEGFLITNLDEGQFEGKFWEQEGKGPVPREKIPVVRAIEPTALEMEAGTYVWCSCGLSKRDPFCDGSHVRVTGGWKGITFEVPKKKVVALCGCRHTKNPPYCDGSHRNVRHEVKT